MVKIICLANSKKNGDRCIAGIDIYTEKWIRSIYINSINPKDGRVPKSIRLINGQEPKLLDIIDIPLDNKGENFGFASENLNVLPGQWKKLGQISPDRVKKHCDKSQYILHNTWKFVQEDYLKNLPSSQRKTIQLAYIKNLFIEWNDKKGWRGSLSNDNEVILNDLPITDPALIKALESDYEPQNPCLVTVSLSMPHLPLIDNWQHGYVCWKLIAGVIELS